MPTITGTNQGDVLTGTNYSDTIEGLNGNDILLGGSGDDILLGGQGHDILLGGSGNDAFYFTSASYSDGIDQIHDYQLGDVIRVNILGFGASSPNDFNYDAMTGDLSFRNQKFATIVNRPDPSFVEFEYVI